MTEEIAYGPTDARPGQPTCPREDCRQFNKLELGRRCRGCGHRTSPRPQPDLFRTLGYQPATAPAPPMPTGAPPTWTGAPPVPTGAPPAPTGVPPMPFAPPRPSAGPVPAAPPAYGSPMPARPPAPALGVRETVSRAVFGGFWCLIGAVAVVAAVSGLAKGDVGGFLLSALVATASGFYARYIFRGGRFRILFW
ncbi:hypothetical protein ABZT17_01745 [Streptomyces sp. NPDC005648]|uniref:hypothetical protein n=1 Tax=Streptomyces sp. NPDC005648 TaxID=3157044 RepID=UPI0033B74DE5